jgi:membrane-associated protease RseP (regulator of RpoE activity)
VTLVTLAYAGGTFWAAGTEDDGLAAALGRGWSYAAAVVAILGAHEMGHYLTCRYYRIPVTLPFFLPFIPPIGSLGAVIRIRGAIPHRRALFDVAAAGPIAGFVVALPILAAGLARAEPFHPPEGLEDSAVWVFGHPAAYRALRAILVHRHEMIEMNSLLGAGWVGLLVTSLNLFPVGQLDGGHAAYAFSRRLHRWLSRATLVGLLALIVWQGTSGEFPAYVVWFAILLWMRDRHPPLLDESVRLGSGRRLVGVVLLAIFLLSVMSVPVRVVEPSL